ncbi:MAG: DUF433 domain-containing protein, partial [Candidatus Binataceae bacterium]
AGELFGTRLPFATKSLKTDGCGIFSDLARIDDVPPGRLHIELSKGQTAYSELVEPFFRKKLDFAPDGLASTYWPLGRRHPVLLDASRSFGRPIVQRTGTPTFVLYQMRQAGEEPARLARWYQITLAELNAALEYEESLRAAA